MHPLFLAPKIHSTYIHSEGIYWIVLYRSIFSEADESRGHSRAPVQTLLCPLIRRGGSLVPAELSGVRGWAGQGPGPSGHPTLPCSQFNTVTSSLDYMLPVLQANQQIIRVFKGKSTHGQGWPQLIRKAVQTPPVRTAAAATRSRRILPSWRGRALHP